MKKSFKDESNEKYNVYQIKKLFNNRKHHVYTLNIV